MGRLSMGCILPCMMHAYERRTSMRWSIGDARLRGACLWEMHAHERHVYEVAYRRDTAMRENTAMRWLTAGLLARGSKMGVRGGSPASG
jgi:hypothetical protein